MEKLKIGVFGLFRGLEYVKQFNGRPDTTVAAVCDRDEERVKEAVSLCKENVKICGSFEELLESGIDAVYIANCFHEHARCAILAMRHGIDVLSECTSAVTMQECVELWETVEETGRKYMLAENEPYAKQNLELARVYREGSLGPLLYAEGEYNHYIEEGSEKHIPGLCDGKYHWRKYMPRTYYLTHSLGPLMFMTGEKPVSVSTIAVHSENAPTDWMVKDAFAQMSCMTDKGSLFRFTGWTSLPGGYGFRVVGENGLAETGRGLRNYVSLIYKDHKVPKGLHERELYEPGWPSSNEKVSASAHGGADWWVAKAFADYVLRGETPFFDYKCGILMSAVAILGWRSVLENGKTLEIPDFSKKEVRDFYRNDDLSPFPDSEGNVAMPCSTWQLK